jgi:hypothetical protein
MRRTTRSACTIALAIAACAPLAAAQTIRTVNAAGPGATPLWDTAVASLQTALAAAQPGDEVWIAAGAYHPTGGRSFSFVIPSGVAVYGGFAGTETSRDQRSQDPSANPTILTGDQSGNDPATPTQFFWDTAYDDNSYHVVTTPPGTLPVTLDRLTITHGAPSTSAASFSADTRGGGLYASAARLVCQNCRFLNNRGGTSVSADWYMVAQGDNGAGAYLDACSAQFIRCTFSGNRCQAGYASSFVTGTVSPNLGTGGAGGAALVSAGSARFVDCVFQDNLAGNGGDGLHGTFTSSLAGPGGRGGALAGISSSLFFTRCQFISNTAGNGGSGGQSFCHSTNPATGGNGGALSVIGGTLTIESCTFLQNVAGNGGGVGGDFTGGPPVAGAPGGAIAATNNSSMVVINSLLYANRAGNGGRGNAECLDLSGGTGGSGGAIYANGPSTLVNCTIVDNLAGLGGAGNPAGAPGAAGGLEYPGPALTMANCILWHNTGLQYSGPSPTAPNCVQSQDPGTGGTNADPMFANTASGNYHLLAGSPCINAGDGSFLSPGDNTDLDNNPRFVTACSPALVSTNPQAGLDMGAYEFQFASPDCNSNGLCDTREVTGLFALSPALPQSGQRFGWALALSPHFAAVGSRSKSNAQGTGVGEVVAYDRIAPAGSTSLSALTSPSTIASPDGAPGDDFGNLLVLSESSRTWLIVGARFADLPSTTDAGAAYVFRRDGLSWTFTQKLTAGTPEAGAEFAQGLAIDGSTLIAGSLHASSAGSTDTGAATVFTLASSTWSSRSTLSASDAATGDGFGISAALSGDTAVIGAAYRSDNGPSSGAAYIFTRSGSVWSQSAKLLAPDGQPNDTFGELVALSGDTILVNAPRHTVLGQSRAGAVYVFRRTSPGGPWAYSATLTSNQPRTGELFGYGLAIDGDAAAIGGFYRSNNQFHDGSAYIFRRIGGPSGTWVRASRIDNPEPDTGAYFGYGIALSGSSFLVGAPLQTVAGTSAVGAVRSFDLSTLDADRSGTIDACDIAAATAPDADHNGIPDPIQSTSCPADFNADSVLSPTDVLDFLTAWFAPAAAADFNANGTVEIQDIFDFLSAWFAGC